ncbi:hypothetical protein U1Q18_036397 [Sarracenia purpurea var. burkii]
MVDFSKGVTEEQGMDPSSYQVRLSLDRTTREPNVEITDSHGIEDVENEGSKDSIGSASGETVVEDVDTKEENVGSDVSESEEVSGVGAKVVSGGNKQWTASLTNSGSENVVGLTVGDGNRGNGK